MKTSRGMWLSAAAIALMAMAISTVESISDPTMPPITATEAHVVKRSAVPGTWQTLLDYDPPHSRFSFACRERAEPESVFELYQFGGTAGPYLYRLTNTTAADLGFLRMYPDASPPAILEGRAEIIQNILYVFGGRTSSSEYTDDVYAIDVDHLESWAHLAPLGTARPSPVRRHATWTAGGRYLVTFGGAKALSLEHRVWAFDTLASSWQLWNAEPPTSSNAPGPRMNPCCVAAPSGDSAYCFGGSTGARTDKNDVWQFFHNNRSWMPLVPAAPPSSSGGDGGPPTPRRLAMCSIVNKEELMVLGGFSSTTNTYVDDGSVHYFNLRTRRWRTTTGHPPTVVSRDHGGLCGFGPQQYLFAGARRDYATGGVAEQNDLYTYNTATGTFDQIYMTYNVPPPTVGHFAFNAYGRLLVGLGATSSSKNAGRLDLAASSHVWLYNHSDYTWERHDVSAALPAADGMPEPRRDACAARRGNAIFVYGGYATAEIGEPGVEGSAANLRLLSDTWSLNLLTWTWRRAGESGSPPPPVVGAACFVVGNHFIVGLGRHSNASLSTSPWHAYDTTLDVWTTLRLEGVIEPTPRAGAVTFTVLGSAAAGNASSTIGKTLVGFGDPDRGSLAAGSGLPDLWQLESFDPIRGTIRWSRRYLNAADTAGSDNLIIMQRAGAEAFAMGDQVLICGGVEDGRFPMPASSICITYSHATNAISPAAAPMPLRLSGARGAYIGDSVVLFGGQRDSETLLRPLNPSSAVQRFVIAAAAKCNGGASSTDDRCLMCSAGALHPSCELSPAGTFVELPGQAATLCPAGTYSSFEAVESALACVQCPAGTYSGQPGASRCSPCPPNHVCYIRTSVPTPLRLTVGNETSSASAAASTHAGGAVPTRTSLRMVQPPAFRSLTSPPLPIAMGVLAVCVAVVSFVLLVSFCSRIESRRRWRRYIGRPHARPEDPPTLYDALDELFKRYADHGNTLSVDGMVAVLSHGEVLAHDLTGSTATDLVLRYDQHGKRHFSFAMMCDFVSNCIATNVVRPCIGKNGEVRLLSPTAAAATRLPQSPPAGKAAATAAADNNNASAEGGALSGVVSDMRVALRLVGSALMYDFARLDVFSDRHLRARMGEPIRIMRTTIGGVATVLFVATAVLVTTTLVYTFFTDNIVETRSTVPMALVSGMVDDPTPRGTIDITAAASGLVLRSFSPVTTSGSSHNQSVAAAAAAAARGACVRPDGTCVGQLFIGVGHVVDVSRPEPSNRTTCEYDAALDKCSMRFLCERCTPVLAAGATQRFEFRFSADITARATHVTVRVETGIRNPTFYKEVIPKYLGSEVLWSELHAAMVPATNGTVFAGGPASVQAIDLTSTYFVSPPNSLSILSSRLVKETGFLLANASLPLPGNAVSHLGASEVFGVPVAVEFSVQPSAVVVQRQHKQTETQFVTALLGANVGLAGFCIFAIQVIDQCVVSAQTRRRARVLREHQKKRREAANRGGGDAAEQQHDPFATAGDDDDPRHHPYLYSTSSLRSLKAYQTSDEHMTAIHIGGGGSSSAPDAGSLGGRDEEELTPQHQRELRYVGRRLLDAEDRDRIRVAGLIAAGVPFHVAMEHLRTMEEVSAAAAAAASARGAQSHIADAIEPNKAPPTHTEKNKSSSGNDAVLRAVGGTESTTGPAADCQAPAADQHTSQAM